MSNGTTLSRARILGKQRTEGRDYMRPPSSYDQPHTGIMNFMVENLKLSNERAKGLLAGLRSGNPEAMAEVGDLVMAFTPAAITRSEGLKVLRNYLKETGDIGSYVLMKDVIKRTPKGILKQIDEFRIGGRLGTTRGSWERNPAFGGGTLTVSPYSPNMGKTLAHEVGHVTYEELGPRALRRAREAGRPEMADLLARLGKREQRAKLIQASAEGHGMRKLARASYRSNPDEVFARLFAKNLYRSMTSESPMTFAQAASKAISTTKKALPGLERAERAMVKRYTKTARPSEISGLRFMLPDLEDVLPPETRVPSGPPFRSPMLPMD